MRRNLKTIIFTLSLITSLNNFVQLNAQNQELYRNLYLSTAGLAEFWNPKERGIYGKGYGIPFYFTFQVMKGFDLIEHELNYSQLSKEPKKLNKLAAGINFIIDGEINRFDSIRVNTTNYIISPFIRYTTKIGVFGILGLSIDQLDTYSWNKKKSNTTIEPYIYDKSMVYPIIGIGYSYPISDHLYIESYLISGYAKSKLYLNAGNPSENVFKWNLRIQFTYRINHEYE
jgi:hypothetical protein